MNALNTAFISLLSKFQFLLIIIKYILYMHINFKSWFALELANNNKYARAIFAQPKT